MLMTKSFQTLIIFISTCFIVGCASDPNAPRFRDVLKPISGRSVDVPAELAMTLCSQEASIAKQQAEDLYEQTNSSIRYETKCSQPTYSGSSIDCKTVAVQQSGGFSFGMAMSNAGHRAKKQAYAMCLMKIGYVESRECYMNCYFNK